jgi:hypothetical protein
MKTLYSKVALVLLASLLAGVCALSLQPQTGAASGLTASANAVSGTYRVVDTGQIDCYNSTGKITCPSKGSAFYGQDAQSTGTAASYINNGNGTITDNNTGLMWQKSPDLNGDGTIKASDKLTYNQAVSYCQNLSLAGYSDWQLPNIKQLYSLIDFSGTDPSGMNGTDTSGLKPFINTRYFDFAYGDTTAGERVIDAQFASSTQYVSTVQEQKLFGVNFADGRIKGYGLSLFGSEKTFYVLCARGNTSYGVNNFVVNGDGTITDQSSGLMWSQADSGAAMSWEAALAWAQTQNASNYLGHNDWRLPNAKELQSILDYTRSPDTTGSAAIDANFSSTSFTNEGGQTDWPWYWSSTTHATYNGMGASAVYVAFGRAGGWQKATPSAACYTLYDVHGAGAQRSDPKTSSGKVVMGTACNGGTAYGLGPQGDIQRAANYVRLVRDTSGSNNSPSPVVTPAPPQKFFKVYFPWMSLVSGPAFTIQNTLSDGAQRNTIAFDALAFSTGSLGADSFFPPGKVADFWGFQYLRDNDPSEMGHNTDFLTRASLNMLNVLTASQRAELVTLARNQVADINQYGYNRFVLMKAFRRQLEGDLPTGTSGLNKDAVMAYSAALYRLDGEISYERAQVMGGLLRNLTTAQRAYLDAMVGKGMLEWPVVSEPEDLRGLDRDLKVAVMTYSGDMFSWYAGSIEADVYFCPERQGTYFGSFYLKDAPAVNNPGYTIPSNLTADLGEAFLKKLTTGQAVIITNLVNDQKPALYTIVERREAISTLLRQFMSGTTPDQATVLSLMEQYGALDGDIITRYALAFSQVSQSLSADQKAQVLALRTTLLGSLSYPSGAYLYSQPISLPDIPNTDFLFK